VGKVGRGLGLSNLQSSCTVDMTSGNLKFLEPSGSLQACIGADLPVLIIVLRLHVSIPTESSLGASKIQIFT